jgi:pimeloyl-ACP methyl ester carboxylesterase
MPIRVPVPVRPDARLARMAASAVLRAGPSIGSGSHGVSHGRAFRVRDRRCGFGGIETCHRRSDGAGPAVVLIHGWPGTAILGAGFRHALQDRWRGPAGPCAACGSSVADDGCDGARMDADIPGLMDAPGVERARRRRP